MANEKLITVFERIIKTEKGKTILSLKEIKTDGSESGTEKAVTTLQNEGVVYFEVVDPTKGFKFLYTKTLSGENYEIKAVEIKKN